MIKTTKYADDQSVVAEPDEELEGMMNNVAKRRKRIQNEDKH